MEEEKLKLELKCIELNRHWEGKRIYLVYEYEYNKYKLRYSEFINKKGFFSNYGEWKDA